MTTIIQGSDLQVWKTLQPEFKHHPPAQFPPLNARSNPLVYQNIIVASIFEPSKIVAYTLEDGRPCWTKKLRIPNFCGVYKYHGRLFCSVASTLFCLDPHSGSELWSFRAASRQASYCTPGFSAEYVFYGDHDGNFYCISQETGKVKWSRRLSEKQLKPVISQCHLVIGDLVYITLGYERFDVLVACDTELGSVKWSVQIPGGLVKDVVEHHGDILVGSSGGVCSLSAQSGEILSTRSWPGCRVSRVSVQDGIVVALLYLQLGRDKFHHLVDVPILTAYSPTGIEWVLSYPAGTRKADFTWSQKTGLIYEATDAGIGIVHPLKGTRQYLIEALHVDGDWVANCTYIPAITSEHICTLCSNGALIVLHHLVR